jgi:hypothetical protein
LVAISRILQACPIKTAQRSTQWDKRGRLRKAFSHHLGDFANAFAADAPISGAYTRKLLEWKPKHATLLEDMEASEYFSPQATSAFDKAAH